MRHLPSHAAAPPRDGDGLAPPLAVAGPELSHHVRPMAVWMRWVAYVTAGQVASGVVITTLPQRVDGGVPIALVSMTVGLALLGLLQWLVLRRCLPGVGMWSWVVVTVLGLRAGTATVTMAVMGSILSGASEGIARRIGGVALQFATSIVTGGLAGGTVGVAQWLVLRRHLPAAAWWIAASMLAHAAARLASVLLGSSSALGGILALAATQLVSGLIAGSITGAALVWLLRQHWAGVIGARAGA